MQFIGTKIPLGASGGGSDTFTSNWILSNTADRITGSVFADQAGTIYIEQSGDQINADVSTSYSVAANNGEGFSEEILLAWVRLRFVNTGSAQTALRIFGRMSSAGVKP